MNKEYKKYLTSSGLASNTVKAYTTAIELYFAHYSKLSHKNLEEYRKFLIKNYKPQSVNLNIIGINRYLSFLGKKEMSLHVLKRQQKILLDNIINNKQYDAMKQQMLRLGEMKKYYIIWTLGATGVRVSELVKLTIEDVEKGFVDIVSKGGKNRRIYFPINLQKSLLKWCYEKQGKVGPIFVNKHGDAISIRCIAKSLKQAAKLCQIDQRLVHPHAFRHLFAKNFLKRKNDIVLLADLLGHESLETTKIYLRHTAQEQWDIVNDVIDW